MTKRTVSAFVAVARVTPFRSSTVVTRSASLGLITVHRYTI